MTSWDRVPLALVHWIRICTGKNNDTSITVLALWQNDCGQNSSLVLGTRDFINSGPMTLALKLWQCGKMTVQQGSRGIVEEGLIN